MNKIRAIFNISCGNLIRCTKKADINKNLINFPFENLQYLYIIIDMEILVYNGLNSYLIDDIKNMK
ncbi:hypothetical protein AN1V17_39750 [Vallitalea sediminicola]